MTDVRLDPMDMIEDRDITYDGMTDRDLLIAVLVELKSVRREHNDTVTKVNDVLTNLAPHLEAVGPMIEALAKNPMFRMLAGGKK